MRKINRGKIERDRYIKRVNFSAAVLWKDKQISLPIEEMTKIRRSGVKKIVFVDERKKEAWLFDIEDVEKNAVFKKEGQEPQYYWSINLRKVHKI